MKKKTKIKALTKDESEVIDSLSLEEIDFVIEGLLLNKTEHLKLMGFYYYFDSTQIEDIKKHLKSIKKIEEKVVALCMYMNKRRKSLKK